MIKTTRALIFVWFAYFMTTPLVMAQQSNPNAFVDSLNDIINVLGYFVLPIVIIVIIVGGIQYSLAGGNPKQAADARRRIAKALVSLIAYIFLWAFLRYLIPGNQL